MAEFYDWQKDAYFAGAMSHDQPLGEADGVRQPLSLDLLDTRVRDTYLETVGMLQMAEQVSVQDPIRANDYTNEIDVELLRTFGPEVGRVIFTRALRDVEDLNKLV